MKSLMQKLFVVAFFAITVAGIILGRPTPLAKAAFNGVMNYQGKLTNSSYVAVPDGTYNMEFKLYDAASSGNLLWTETRTGGNKVQVTNGLFSVMLGEVANFSGFDFNKTLFLTVNIGGTGSPSWDGEMSPRKKLGAVPVAFLASNLAGEGIIDITNTSAPQASFGYDGSNKLTVSVGNSGVTTLNVIGSGTPAFNLTGGNVGIGTASTSAKLHVTANSEQFRTSYDAGNYTSFTTSSGGDLTIAPSGSDLAVTGNVDVSGTLTAGTGNAFNVDASGNITAGAYQGSIIASNYGGTGNGFTKFSGPASTEKTFTLPNSSATILTTAAAVTAAQGGTGFTTYTLGDMIYSDATNSLAKLAGNTTTTRKFLRQTGNGSISAAPAWDTLTSTDVGLANVENTALSTWAGTTNITTLGTITSGTWSGTTIAVNKGGTGTTDGSITGTGALAFTASGAGNGITLTGNTTGVVTVASSTANTDTIKIKPQVTGTAATFNGTITSADLTGADKTWTFPNVSGTIITTGDTGTVTNTMLGGSIAASKLVGTDIATVGTITSGTWNGTAINPQFGGTGQDTSNWSGLPTVNDGTWQNNSITGGVAFGDSISNTISFISPSNNTVLTGGLGGVASFSATPQVTTLTGSTSIVTPLLTRAGALSITTTSGNGAISLTPNGTGAITHTTGATTTDANTFTNASFAPTSGNSVSTLNLAFTNVSANTGNSIVNGLLLSPTQNVTSGSDVHQTNGINLGAIATNTCTGGGTCNKYGIYAASSNNYTDLFNYNGTSVINSTGQLNAAQLTGTVPSGSISGAYTGITQVGTITTGVWNGTAINGTYINYNTTNLQVSTNQLNTIQDIATSSTPQFARLGLGTVTSSTALLNGSLTAGMRILASAQGSGETSGVSIVDLATTWNNGANTPTAIKLNITDTASNANSLLFDIGTGGGSYVSKFKVDKSGNITIAGTTGSTGLITATAGVSVGASQSYTGAGAVTLSSGGSSGLTLDSASGRLTVATGDFLKTSVAGVSGAAAGDIWYDSTALKYKINENGTTKTLCNTTDLGCGAGGGITWDAIGDPTDVGDIDMGTTLQSLSWSSIGPTEDAFTITNSGSQSSGSAFKITTAASSSVSNGLIQFIGSANYSGSGGLLNVTANSTTTGTVVKISGTSLTTGTALSVIGNTVVQSNAVNAFQLLNNSGLSVVNVNNSSGSGFANLINNPSFEQNIHNWVAKGTPTGSTPIWDNTASNAKYGSGTMKLIGDAVGDGTQYNFPFVASTAYSASFWAKTASGTATLRLDRQDNGSDVGGCSDSAVTTTWTQFTCTFTTGGTVNTSTSNIFIKQNAAGTPTVFIDGFTLTLGSTSLAYTMPANNIQVDADYSNITLNAGQKADIQPWQLNSTALPSGRRGATSITANGFAYFIGGTTANGSSGAPVTTINYTRINADGSLSAGSWGTTTVLPVALYGHSTFVANGYVYVIGGCSDSSTTAACTTPVSTVYYAKLNSDGTVGTWQTNANTLPAARGFGSAVFSNGYVYYLGGYNASAQTTVYSGRLNADGSVSGWTTTSVTALGSGRYGHTTMNVNGKIYSIGGCSDAGALCNTAITTVEYATPANDGTLGSWTAATSLPTATGFHTTTMLNGYLFNMGGRQSSAAVTTVYYSKVNSVGPLGIWSTSSYALPAARQQATGLFVNSFLYNMGGYDGTATLPTTAYFTSGARVSIFGGLDLVGLTAQTLTDYSGGGTLTAGNTRVVGDLRVDGFADLNNGLTVDSVINLNAVSSVVGQSVFNVNNLNSNSIFSIRHMSTNFGSLANAGAFVSNMSYFGDEFSIHNRNTALTADTAGGVGDTQEMYFDTFTGTATTYTTPASVINGVGRVSYPATSGTGAVIANGKVTAATMDTPFQSANLPVVQMKVKPSANTNTNDMIFGLTGTYAASGTNDTLPANGIYFWNNNAAGGWQGVVRSSSANVGTVTCTGSISTTQFATLRIEVLVGTGASGQVRFAVDNDASDGVNFIDCGTVTGTLPAGPFASTISNIHTVAATATVDIDYIRIWQDDSGVSPDQTTEQVIEPPLTIDSPTAEFNAKVFLANLMSQTDPEAIEANSEGIAVHQTDFDRLVAKTELITPKITAGGLVIDKVSALDNIISFMDDAEFFGRPYFNQDTAGFAQIKEGDKQVKVTFIDPYLAQPIVNASISAEGNENDDNNDEQQDELAQTLFDAGLQYLIINKTIHGFTIVLNKPAPKDMFFSWTALAVKDAKVYISSGDPDRPSEQQQANESGDEDSGDGEVAGAETEATPPEETEDPAPDEQPEEQQPPEDTPPPSEG